MLMVVFTDANATDPQRLCEGLVGSYVIGMWQEGQVLEFRSFQVILQKRIW